ncbi:MAG: hypothetical protein ACRD0S_10490 [Acidimicrobiales bacterium]
MRLLTGPAGRTATVVLAGALVASCGGGDGGSSSASTTTTTGPGATTSTTAAPGYGPAVLAGEVADPEVDESSGLAASRRNPGLLWTHNDSGDEPRIFCLTAQAARCGTWTVAGAKARDWEDMAAGPGPAAGEPYLYLGDIGDNKGVLEGVVVYRVREPQADAGGATATGATERAEAIPLRYDDGPHDAEALMVHPTTGDLYVITKALVGVGVYKAPPGTAVLTRIASFDLGVGHLVTGADIAPDGRRVAVSTYRSGYELTLPESESSFDAIWSQPPQPVDLGLRAQGEAVAYRLDGTGLFASSEKAPARLFLTEQG